VIVSDSADMALAAKRVMMGKTMNAGQICLAPDYVMVPQDKARDFVHQAAEAISTMFPTLKENPDYTSVINQRHFDRLQGYLDDARAKGAEIVEINPAGEDFSQQEHRKIPPTLILNPTDDMKVMQEEIFGPVLPIVTYRTLDEALAFVNDRPRPLALYYFDDDAARARSVLARTTSGGAVVNDVMIHCVVDDLPFGGVGASGIGAYHGIEGFETFSHRKAVFAQPRLNGAGLLSPPYGKRFDRLLKLLIG
jgi:coniferyl-aldehyde dehydrogenase